MAQALTSPHLYVHILCLQELQASKTQLEKDLRSVRQERNALLATLRKYDHTGKSTLPVSREHVSEHQPYRHAPNCSDPVRKPFNEVKQQESVSQHSSVATTPLKDCFPASYAGLPQKGKAGLQHGSDFCARISSDEDCPMSRPSVTPHSNQSLATKVVSVGKQQPDTPMSSAKPTGLVAEPESPIARLQQLQQLAESLLS